MATNDRFIFGNQTLADWLLQLVSEDAAIRKAAARVIVNEFYLPEKLILESGKDAYELQAEFSAAVRASVGRTDFPAADFVRNILALKMALHDSWCEKVKADFKSQDAADDADLAKLGENSTEAEKRRYVRRVWIRCLRDCKKIAKDEPHEAMSTGITLTYVIESLGVELLPGADLLREMLSSKGEAHTASDAIARMGRPGLEFYGDLLRGLKSDDGNHYSAKALGALLKTAPEKIPEVLQLTHASSGHEQASAISALGYCGKQATEFCPDVEAWLLAILESNPQSRLWYAVVGALGDCARSSKTVDALLARLDSDDAGQKGEIISALGSMGVEPNRVVPRLIEMLDAYEEYDPDWQYFGEHGRVVCALRGFGSAAASAVPALERHIWQKEHSDPDDEVIKFLGELGPVAREALPSLQQVRVEMRQRNAATDAYDDTDTCWCIAIKRIESMGK
jgi:hypothetical protein